MIGALLAGGQSKRMGRPKAGVLWQPGVSMGERALNALRAVTSDVVIVGHGDGLDDDLPRLADARDEAGPLAGIEALLITYPTVESLITTCDMPLVDARMLARLPRPPKGGVALFDDGTGDTEPFPMRLHPGAISPLKSWLDGGRRDVRGFVAQLPQRTTPLNADEAEALANVNRPSDLDTARKIASRPSSTIQHVHPTPLTNPVKVAAFRHGGWTAREDLVAVEEPLEIRIGALSVVVLMRTPGHDEDLALGFLLNEGILGDPAQLHSLRHCTETPDSRSLGNIIVAQLVDGAPLDPASIQRNFYASASCGVCGKTSIDSVLSGHSRYPSLHSTPWSLPLLMDLPDRMRAQQSGFQATGALHAAALFSQQGELLVIREDVGRHNAVDKVVGAWMRTDPDLPQTVALAVSGRVSFEIVQKAIAARVPVVVAVSAPTSLAVELANEGGLTLVGFARGKRMNVYTHPERVMTP